MLLGSVVRIIIGVVVAIGASLLIISANQDDAMIAVGGNNTMQMPAAEKAQQPGYKPAYVMKRQLGNRVVSLLGEVNGFTSEQVIRDLGRLNEKSADPITLVINSPGGSVLAGAQIVGAIESSRAPVDTVCIELCASMAALIHQYGRNRLVFAHSVLMFHPAAGGAQDDVDRMASMLTMLQRYTLKMEANTAKRAGMSLTEYKARANTQIWLDGEDAVLNKFADAVVFFQGSSISRIFQPGQTIELKQQAEKKQLRGIINAVVNYFFGPTSVRETLGDFK